MWRFTRLTNAFSKKPAFHLYAVALNFMHYNNCRPHETLTKASRHQDDARDSGRSDGSA